MPIDLTRSLLVVLIPGGVAVAPWLWCVVFGSPDALNYIEKFSSFALAVIFGVIVIVGLICETVGTWIEIGWDRKRENEYGVEENWYRYLANQVSPEPVGYRYLSRRATAFYFELSMFVACLPFAAGVALFAVLAWPALLVTALFVVTLSLCACVWFWLNARTTHALLCRTRMEINHRMRLTAGAGGAIAVPAPPLGKP